MLFFLGLLEGKNVTFIILVKMRSYGGFELWLSVIFSYGFELLNFVNLM